MCVPWIMAVAVILHVALAGILHDALRVEDVLPEYLLAVVLTPGGSPWLQFLSDHRDDVIWCHSLGQRDFYFHNIILS